MSQNSLPTDTDTTPTEIVVDLATVMPWHGLSPAEHAQLRGEVLTELTAALPSAPSTDDDLTSRQAAKMLGLTRPDGSPRDSFYKLVDELGGYRVHGGYRFPRARIEAYKKNGGVQ